MEEPVLLKHRGIENYKSIAVYEEHGGYEATRKALQMEPGDIIQQVKDSMLRGRGGAGFPTGMKWGFLPKQNEKPVYLCVNADESEPGTFKDREIIEFDPHQLLEGTIITSYAIGAHKAFIYIRGEFALGAKILEEAVEEARERGYVGSTVCDKDFELDIVIHRGAGAYICGEETGLIESLEGKRAYPRVKPPFPAVYGLFGCPTIVNNVETLACVPHIVSRGPEWFKSIGPEKGPGPKLFSVSGHVQKPGVFELPMGTPLLDLIYNHCGGPTEGRSLKAVIPGGSSVPILRAEDCDINLDFDSVQAAGSLLGSAGIIVMDDSTDMVAALKVLAKFYHEESCGQCTPCREGTGWLYKLLQRIDDGTGRPEDVQLLNDVADNMMGNTVCTLADAAAMPVQSFLKGFRDEFLAKLTRNSSRNEAAAAAEA